MDRSAWQDLLDMSVRSCRHGAGGRGERDVTGKAVVLGQGRGQDSVQRKHVINHLSVS